MKLLVGLGNIGKEYQGTRHNIGFDVIDLVAIGLGCKPEEFSSHSKAKAQVIDLISEHDCMLAKPSTMMNLSGQAIGEMIRFYKINPDSVWAVYDDVDLPFGQIRIRKSGPTGGGHNGVKSMIDHIGQDFWRVRIGVSNAYLASTPTDKFVLSRFNEAEANALPSILSRAAVVIENALDSGTLPDTTIKLEV